MGGFLHVSSVEKLTTVTFCAMTTLQANLTTFEQDVI
jgi:hypothetical protein